jgi:hypothetical protein
MALALDVQSEPERIAELLRPIEPSHRRREIVVVDEGRTLAEMAEIAIGKPPQQIDDLA